LQWPIHAAASLKMPGNIILNMLKQENRNTQESALI
jgi:hypothetical protein